MLMKPSNFVDVVKAVVHDTCKHGLYAQSFLVGARYPALKRLHVSKILPLGMSLDAQIFPAS